MRPHDVAILIAAPAQQTQFGAAFVGAIVASLDERLPFGVSVMNWFVARAEDDQEDGCVALSMACAAARDGEPDADAVLEGCRAAVRVTSRRARMRLDSLVKGTTVARKERVCRRLISLCSADSRR